MRQAAGGAVAAEVVVPMPRGRGEESLWAVIAWFGTRRQIAEVFSSRARALADCTWREQEVRAYVHLLSDQPVPRYGVAPVRRSDLPKKWKPLPALGFLR
jgi:hypothetical protein